MNKPDNAPSIDSEPLSPVTDPPAPGAGESAPESPVECDSASPVAGLPRAVAALADAAHVTLDRAHLVIEALRNKVKNATIN